MPFGRIVGLLGLVQYKSEVQCAKRTPDSATLGGWPTWSSDLFFFFYLSGEKGHLGSPCAFSKTSFVWSELNKSWTLRSLFLKSPATSEQLNVFCASIGVGMFYYVHCLNELFIFDRSSKVEFHKIFRQIWWIIHLSYQSVEIWLNCTPKMKPIGELLGIRH